ncbi:MAG: hypothetical protein DA408_11030 [Bacteroidetes bacterium]|nr:MAG: hypothetical protein C7N36_03425 [Bacteroidota bacterium]PTM12301.1 MAG: hypothetical protein DA408_11030 [Bacteroidota bacterium]
MKTGLFIEGGRPLPPVLAAFFNRAGYQLVPLQLAQDTWPFLVKSAAALLLMLPDSSQGMFLLSGQLWHRYLLDEAPECQLLFASYQAVSHPNHLDILELPTAPTNWIAQAFPVGEMKNLPPVEGMDLQEKLHRFFAGHGDDSIVAVLSRIRLVVQMASREQQRMNTPYPEIFQELVAPAQLDKKWAEWRNRWINYYPLFENTPIAVKLHSIARAATQLEDWMMTGGRDEESLVNGTILRILNDIRKELQQIEKQYVVQKLSYPYR